MPLFDYELLLFNELQNHKHLWVKKATGLGVTEFMLRYMAWLCFNGSAPKELIGSATSSAKSPAIQIQPGSQMCIVTGPRIELAITLIDRMKALFLNLQGQNILASQQAKIQFNTKETVIELNGVHIEAYPSHHLDSMRWSERCIIHLS